MKTKTFWIVLWSVLAVCLALTMAHFIYTIYAYQHCSIIYFIGKEHWGTDEIVKTNHRYFAGCGTVCFAESIYVSASYMPVVQ